MWSLFKRNGQEDDQHKNGKSGHSSRNTRRGDARAGRRVLVPMQVGLMVVMVPRYDIRASDDLAETHSLPE